MLYSHRVPGGSIAATSVSSVARAAALTREAGDQPGGRTARVAVVLDPVGAGGHGQHVLDGAARVARAGELGHVLGDGVLEPHRRPRRWRCRRGGRAPTWSSRRRGAATRGRRRRRTTRARRSPGPAGRRAPAARWCASRLTQASRSRVRPAPGICAVSRRRSRGRGRGWEARISTWRRPASFWGSMNAIVEPVARSPGRPGWAWASGLSVASVVHGVHRKAEEERCAASTTDDNAARCPWAARSRTWIGGGALSIRGLFASSRLVYSSFGESITSTTETGLDDPAGVQDLHAVGDRAHQRQVVGDEEHADAAGDSAATRAARRSSPAPRRRAPR